MANGQQIANENLVKFEKWIAQRKAHGDKLEYIRNGKLNRSEVAKELGFGRSVFAQNPAVKELATKLDDEWGKLKPAIPKSVRELTEARELANNKVKRTESANSKHLEKIAMLEAENRQLKVQLAEIENFKTVKLSFLEKVEFLK